VALVLVAFHCATCYTEVAEYIESGHTPSAPGCNLHGPMAAGPAPTRQGIPGTDWGIDPADYLAGRGNR
jgi:hypothetical protein